MSQLSLPNFLAPFVQAVDMIKAQSKRASHNYPFAAVGVNLTLLLGELALLRDRAFEVNAASFWGVFEHPGAFFEVIMCAPHN